eukprot:TRINITY_DN2472_c0_g1_i2.p1 TRINITY_DN2472_c0_g1~~TRINITY_DN2472_c0_g1_i2.p1  ORF type:complete len:245 (+),score=48.78 TRINITY_DN2472_c0_g1_i2:652-1386(+)
MGYTCMVHPKEISNLENSVKMNIMRVNDIEEYGRCIFAWLSGLCYCTNFASGPISAKLLPHVDKLLELCCRGFFPLSTLLSEEDYSKRQKETLLAFVPKKWAKPLGDKLKKTCYFSATDSTGSIDICHYNPDELDEEGAFPYLEKTLSVQKYMMLGLPPKVAIAMAKKGEMHVIGSFDPQDTEEKEKWFSHPSYSPELRDEIGSQLAFLQISSRKMASSGALIDNVLSILTSFGFNQNYTFQNY